MAFLCRHVRDNLVEVCPLRPADGLVKGFSTRARVSGPKLFKCTFALICPPRFRVCCDAGNAGMGVKRRLYISVEETEGFSEFCHGGYLVSAASFSCLGDIKGEPLFALRPSDEARGGYVVGNSWDADNQNGMVRAHTVRVVDLHQGEGVIA